MRKEIIVSAGDCWTAKLIEKEGFDGIWISGFEACARLNLPDNGSITMTEMLSIARPIVNAVKIPVWVDVDTGYGNFSRTVREFEKIGVTGVCVEDNLPEHKQNSLWGDKIPLMSKEDFGKKLNSVGAWDDRKISIIARTEALIRGYGMREAEERLKHYSECGADILLPHTRSMDDIFLPKKIDKKFAIIPTKFPDATNDGLSNLGYSMIIWANQTERTKIKAIKDMLKILRKDDCAINIDGKISSTIDDMKELLG